MAGIFIIGQIILPLRFFLKREKNTIDLPFNVQMFYSKNFLPYITEQDESKNGIQYARKNLSQTFIASQNC